MTKKLEWGLLIAILILGIFFRFYNIKDTPPGLSPDEALHGSNALESLETGRFKLFYPEHEGLEGLFITMQALSIKTFGAYPWALRIASALIGSLTIFGIWLLTKELFMASPRFAGIALPPSTIALFSSFFLASSFWHIHFSRIGLGVIMIPFFASFGLYWLAKAFRTGALTDAILAGLIFGGGFYTTSAWFVTPLIILATFIVFIRRWKSDVLSKTCAPCVASIIFFVGLVVTLPMLWHSFETPADPPLRTTEPLVFSAEKPLYEFARSSLLGLGMFNARGDCSTLHNFQCAPELHWLVGIFFLLGVWLLIRGLYKDEDPYHITSWMIAVSFAVMLLPGAIVQGSSPNALRSIGAIVPAMIIAGLGATWLWMTVQHALDRALQNPVYANRYPQLGRLKKESVILILLLAILIASQTFLVYHVRFAESKEAYLAFSTGLTDIAYYLKSRPASLAKYVIANGEDDSIRGIPISSQPIMFITETFTSSGQTKHNLHYVLEENITSISAEKPSLIIPLELTQKALRDIRAAFPTAKPTAPGAFAIFEVQ